MLHDVDRTIMEYDRDTCLISLIHRTLVLQNSQCCDFMQMPPLYTMCSFNANHKTWRQWGDISHQGGIYCCDYGSAVRDFAQLVSIFVEAKFA